ncbi:MAG TPA: hypothetical protein VKB47_08770 [Terracidiphilus sp.]|nr:hypothetical protein [Terracidiphilus sp.]
MQFIAVSYFRVKGADRVVVPGDVIETTARRLSKQIAAGMVAPIERAPELAVRRPRATTTDNRERECR